MSGRTKRIIAKVFISLENIDKPLCKLNLGFFVPSIFKYPSGFLTVQPENVLSRYPRIRSSLKRPVRSGDSDTTLTGQCSALQNISGHLFCDLPNETQLPYPRVGHFRFSTGIVVTDFSIHSLKFLIEVVGQVGKLGSLANLANFETNF
ncbi:jg2795 [Pararge aegeria aegeria]|uniref:Jg2795 protein n=1 Tax=Pararge aegeria aegeria TaxID=348720 RepID=A0A8S4QD39_9NEOP|nr:jg2795 [Pararge aegeria aegeria]